MGRKINLLYNNFKQNKLKIKKVEENKQKIYLHENMESK